MKLVFILLALFAIAGTLANSFKITKPHKYQTWKVGSTQTIQISGDFKDGDTVAFFFSENRSTLLGGGPSQQKTFKVTVPECAISPPGNYTTLIAVQRFDNYLDAVQVAPIRVIG
ncbi:hypothetical protein INT43_001897 [Umbelopsis isabellina]|uniref:Uncharacterized protein n=1 Tax=Mortierella isabellina TaxID=91625 RepID=A0A8H7UGI2_MORIS|nr:hypothetical protein INT43_001897 [Umbelopsis isabellina]